MEYKKFGDLVYIRMDRGDEIIETIKMVCQKEQIRSATFSGIGGCGDAEIQTYIPETNSFEIRKLQGMLELVSLTGNIVQEEDGSYTHHTHGMFAYKEGEKHKVAGGHLKTIGVSYTAELELRPVIGERIMHKYDEETGTGFWTFAEGLDD